MARAPRLRTQRRELQDLIRDTEKMLGRKVEPDDSSFGRAMDVFAQRWNQLPEGRLQNNPGVDYTQQDLGPGVRSGASVSRGQADVLEAEMNQSGPGLLHEISNRQGGRMARKLPPASIRYNNPGAMYPGPVSKYFGSTRTETIGGGHKIAVFDRPEQGVAAHFGLLARSYTGMTLQDAIKKWSGGNSNAAYADFVARQTGLRPDTVLTRQMLADPRIGIPFARAQATWEAGQPYPLTTEQWAAGHALAVRSPFSERGAITQRTLPSPTTPPVLPQGPLTPGRDPMEATRQMMAQTRPQGPQISPEGLDPSQPIVAQGPISPVAEAPQVRPTPQPQAGKAPDQAPYRRGGDGGVPSWAVEAFARADNQPVDPVQSQGTLANLIGPVPPAPPSTDDFLMNRNTPLRGLLGTGGRSGIFSGIFSGGGFFGGGGGF